MSPTAVKPTPSRSARSPRVIAKRHHSERFRTPTTLQERWTHEKSALTGFWYGQGKTCTEIAAILNDGTISQTINALVHRRWKLPVEGTKRGIHVELSAYSKKLLLKQSKALGIEPEEFLSRILHCVIGDDMYNAVTGGK